MVATLGTVVSLLAYVGGWLLTARWRYARTRPLAEPLNCTYPDSCRRSRHSKSCYLRDPDSLVETRAQAAVFALMLGAVWPLIGPAMAVMWVVEAGQRETLAEVRARNERLERELGMRGDQ